MSSRSSTGEEFYVRDTPELSSGVIWSVLVIVLAAVSAWEFSMRDYGLLPADSGDGPSHWSVERRRLDDGNVDVAIIGASRVLFNTNLDVFEEVTGFRPVQLALAGTSPQSFLADIAENTDFDGLLIVGMTEVVFYQPIGTGLFEGALDYYRNESPSARLSHYLYVRLSDHLAFIEPGYSLVDFLSRLEYPARPGTLAPYDEVWKIGSTGPDRQTRLWYRIEEQGFLNAHATHAWQSILGYLKPVLAPGYAPESVAKTIETTAGHIETIRGRGGEVVFIRSPSTAWFREHERQTVPREKFYDPMIERTGTLGLHFEDYPAMQGLTLPEWSHLSADDARVFTRVYTEELVRQLPYLAERMSKEGTQ
jgi:hypothetical protein